MTLKEHARIYWTISQCWNNEQLAVRQRLTFGKTVELLRGIIEDPQYKEYATIKVLAKLLLDDIAKNSTAPTEVKTKLQDKGLYGKRVTAIIIDDIDTTHK